MWIDTLRTCHQYRRTCVHIRYLYVYMYALSARICRLPTRRRRLRRCCCIAYVCLCAYGSVCVCLMMRTKGRPPMLFALLFYTMRQFLLPAHKDTTQSKPWTRIAIWADTRTHPQTCKYIHGISGSLLGPASGNRHIHSCWCVYSKYIHTYAHTITRVFKRIFE